MADKYLNYNGLSRVKDKLDLLIAEKASLSTASVTLTVAGWANSTQTVSVSGVTATNHVVVSYAPASKDDYTAADVYCSGQGSGTLTFTCGEVPASDLTANVLILE